MKASVVECSLFTLLHVLGQEMHGAATGTSPIYRSRDGGAAAPAATLVMSGTSVRVRNPSTGQALWEQVIF